MRATRLVILTVLVAACAPRIFPTVGNPDVAIPNAERILSEATAIGADSLVPSAMQEAREHLAEAQLEQRTRDMRKASLKSRQAVASATYAKAAAERAIAERARTEAQASLSALPNKGGAR